MLLSIAKIVPFAAEELQNQLIGLSGLAALAAGTTLLLFIGRFHNEDCAACCGAFRPLVQNYFAHMFSLCQMLLVD